MFNEQDYAAYVTALAEMDYAEGELKYYVSLIDEGIRDYGRAWPSNVRRAVYWQRRFDRAQAAAIAFTSR